MWECVQHVGGHKGPALSTFRVMRPPLFLRAPRPPLPLSSFLEPGAPRLCALGSMWLPVMSLRMESCVLHTSRGACLLVSLALPVLGLLLRLIHLYAWYVASSASACLRKYSTLGAPRFSPKNCVGLFWGSQVSVSPSTLRLQGRSSLHATKCWILSPWSFPHRTHTRAYPAGYMLPLGRGPTVHPSAREDRRKPWR